MILAVISCLLLFALLPIGFLWHTLRDPVLARIDDAFDDSDSDRKFKTYLEEQNGVLVAVESLYHLNLIALTVAWFTWRNLWPPQEHTVSEWLIYAGNLILFLAITGLVGHLIPWAWSQVSGEALVVRMWPFLRGLSRLWGLKVSTGQRLTTLFHRLYGQDENNGHSEEAVRTELRTVVEEGQREGLLGDQAGRMIQRVMALPQNDVATIMTIRSQMVTLHADATLKEARTTLEEAGHSRIPIIEETADDIVGILYAKDLLTFLGDDSIDQDTAVLRDMPRREVHFVSEMMSLESLFEKMREEQTHLQIVLDEYGAVCGLVTMEDLLEEIVGDIEDEYDPENREELIQQHGNGDAEVLAHANLLEIEEQLSIDIPDGDYETIAGFVISLFGRIPEKGESKTWSEWRFVVNEADGRRIHKILIQHDASLAHSSSG